MRNMRVEALPAYKVSALEVLYLLRKSIPLIVTFGPLGPMTFDLWGRNYQKMHLGASGYPSARYGPWGFFGY